MAILVSVALASTRITVGFVWPAQRMLNGTDSSASAKPHSTSSVELVSSAQPTPIGMGKDAYVIRITTSLMESVLNAASIRPGMELPALVCLALILSITPVNSAGLILSGQEQPVPV